ncbi:MAG: hypothetical protein CMB80_17945 [Flammeovirgaceae bacterium]|nr:hypothetical protein [Flammeovirgaceae bacterium]MBR06720.1 hypothetical protein [Rickettsiales bacterium]
MNIYAKLTLLCVVLVVITSSVVYFLVNMELENAFGSEAIQAMADNPATISTTVQNTIDGIQTKLIWTVLAVIAGSIVLALAVANMFVKPILKITKAAESIAAGNLETEIPVNSNDELGKLADNLNKASKGLIKRLAEQRKFNETLEAQKDEIHSQKLKIEEVNNQISDSIVYAHRIQKSILPELNVMSRLVKDAFVIYKPKDVVSGDFYWFERVRQGRNEYLIIACADCTGHGVPGAIMSIMGSNQLTNIVYYQNYLDPIKILARLDKVIKFELQRDDNDEKHSRDGMEIGICVINLDDLSMEFAGVGIPLYIIKNGATELETYKSPKMMVGGIEGDEKEVSEQLEKQTIQLEEGDKIFLASDGYQDQFGGDNDKKFMTKNFKKLIEDGAKSPMSDLKESLETEFDNWKGNTPQTDDIVVLGVEI